MKLLRVAVLLWPVGVIAGPLSEPTTVATFVKDFQPSPGPKEPKRTPAQFLRYQKAQGFIDGVKDATEGTAWCYDKVTQPVELDNVIYHGLLKLSPSQQMDRAGPMIVRQLQLKYPCHKERGS